MIKKLNLSSKKRENHNSNSLLLALGLSLTFSYIFTFSIILLLSYLITYSDMNDQNTKLFLIFTTIIASFICGFITGKKMKVKGIFYGGLAGLFYALVYLAIGFLLAENPVIVSKTLSSISISVFSGMIGGIIAVNKAEKRR